MPCSARYHVGVRQLIHQRDLGMAGEHGVEIHFGEARAAVGHRAPRHDLESFGHRRGQLQAVRFQEPDDHVRAASPAALALGEHRVGLPDVWCGAEIDAELSPGHAGVSASAQGPAYHRRRPGSGPDTACCTVQIAEVSTSNLCR